MTTDQELRGVARGGTANLLGAVVAAVTSFGTTVVVTRAVTTSQAGVFFTSTSLFLLLSTLCMLGANTGLVYFVARLRAVAQPQWLPAYFKTAVRPVALLGVVTAVLVWVLAAPLAGVINPDHPESATTYLRVLALLVPFAALENVILAATRGLSRMRANVWIAQVARPTAQLVLVGVAVIAVDDPAGLALGWVLPFLPAALAAWWWWRRDVRRLLARPPGAAAPATGVAAGVADPEALSDRPARRFWAFSAPRALASLGQITIQRLDIILVAALAGSTEAAIYAATTRFLVVGQMGNRAVSTAVQPRLAQTLSRHDIAGTNRLYRASTAWLMMLNWPMYLLLVVFAPVVLLVFGPEYQAGATVLVVLCLCMLLATACGMVDMVLTMGGRTSWNLANVSVGLAVNIGLDLWLIPRIGMMGAAIGWGAAIVVQNVLALTQTGLTQGIHPFGTRTLTVGALAVGCYGIVPLAARAVAGSTWTGLAIGAVAGSILYAFGLARHRGLLELAALLPRRRSRDVAAD